MMPSVSNRVRQAAEYVLEKRRDNPDAKLAELIDEAGMRFNLTPLDAEALAHVLREGGDEK